MNSEIFSLLHRLGITPNYAGYFQTAQAVELCVEDPERLTLVTKLVYAEVGKRYGASWKTVERNIRTVSIIAWERSLPALEELIGCTLDSRPHTSQFLAALTERVLYGLSSRTALQNLSPQQGSGTPPLSFS